MPLNPSSSDSSQRSGRSRLGYDTAVDDAERRLLNVTQRPTVDISRLRTSPQQISQFQGEQNGNTVLGAQQAPPKRSVSNLRDINAMSVASIYDREHNEIMDADK